MWLFIVRVFLAPEPFSRIRDMVSWGLLVSDVSSLELILLVLFQATVYFG